MFTDEQCNDVENIFAKFDFNVWASVQDNVMYIIGADFSTKFEIVDGRPMYTNAGPTIVERLLLQQEVLADVHIFLVTTL